jgi:hypothetical protein
LTSFDVNWLELREPLDQAARSKELTVHFIEALNSSPEPVIMDIGGGTAANFRMLAPQIARNQHWQLIDHDPTLIQHSFIAVIDWAHSRGWESQRLNEHTLIVYTSSGHWTLAADRVDIAKSVEHLSFQNVDAIVTSAFLDLVSADWIQRFSDCLSEVRRPFFATLTVDGRRLWSPAHPDDDWIETLFRLHQSKDKGFGNSIGIEATAAISIALEKANFDVHVESSDWLVDCQHHKKLLTKLLNDALDISIAMKPSEAPRIQEWYRLRQSQMQTHKLAYRVGHLDLLALPQKRFHLKNIYNSNLDSNSKCNFLYPVEVSQIVLSTWLP